MSVVNATVQGVLLGGLYALLAAGLALVFGVMRLVNLAHGALAILGAYVGLGLISGLGLPPFVAIAGVVPIMAALGWVLQRVLFDAALVSGGLAPVLATFGLAVVVQNALVGVVSADNRSIPVDSLAGVSVALPGGINVGVIPLITLAAGILAILAIQSFLTRTRTGWAVRATSDDREAAAMVGIDVRRAFAVAAMIAMAMAGIAGVFVGMRTQFNPFLGDLLLIFAFEAVVIGGLGSLWGALAGGMILGVAQTIGAQVAPSSGVLLGHIVFLVVLAFRPAGLFSRGAKL